MSSAQADYRPETGPLPKIFGRYLLVQRLSRGGMGEIFLARHGLSGFEKFVVIKKVLPHLAADEEFIARFIDEAQVAVKLQHANIAQVYEVGRVGDEYFLALEYIEGRDLRRTLSILSESGRGLPVDLALAVARDVCTGLAYAHRRTDAAGESLELVHCDISPPNIMMSFEGETKIIDFGIAKSALRAQSADSKRGFGKFGYMSPEQLIRGRKVDFRTDIYAAGVILYEMLTGQRLYTVGDTPDYKALARMAAKGQHPLPSDHDAKLAPYDDLVRKALQPQPDKRYPSAAAFRDALQGALVDVSPTMNPDQLGAFMRYMFAEEVLETKKELESIDQTDIDHFKDEMSVQAAETISFAFAEAPRTTAAPPRVPSAPPEPAPRPRSWKAIALAALIAAVLAAGIAFAVARHSQDDGARAVAGTESADAAVEAEPANADASVAATVEPADAGARPTVTPLPQTPDAAPRRAARRVDKKRVTQKRDSKPELTAAQVKARFRAVKREYASFKKKYGGRLESDWVDLANLITNASGPDKLAAINRKISSFRAKMRRFEQ